MFDSVKYKFIGILVLHLAKSSLLVTYHVTHLVGLIHWFLAGLLTAIFISVYLSFINFCYWSLRYTLDCYTMRDLDVEFQIYRNYLGAYFGAVLSLFISSVLGKFYAVNFIISFLSFFLSFILYLSIYLLIYWLICLFIYLFIHLFIYLLIYLVSSYFTDIFFLRKYFLGTPLTYFVVSSIYDF